MEIDFGEFIERTNFEEEESKLSRTFFMFVYSVVFHFDEILLLIIRVWFRLNRLTLDKNCDGAGRYGLALGKRDSMISTFRMEPVIYSKYVW